LYAVPLTEVVSFKACLQKGNRIMVPKPVRWRFKLESSQVLRVVVHPLALRFCREKFYGRMDKSGRITVPRLVLKVLEGEFGEGRSLVGAILDVAIEPA
jgi:bifunctional DNA-binding transcriptional regulator/antitoxin component of YhaV-PrlF toxin-antitoxin module